MSREKRQNDRGQGSERSFCVNLIATAYTFLLSRAVTRIERGTRKLLFIDVRRAPLHSTCDKSVFPESLPKGGHGKDKAGKLRFCLYLSRQAAQEWEALHAFEFLNVRSVRRTTNTVVFYYIERDPWCAVHGDDFTY